MNTRGFTIVEMIVVVAVIVILATVGLIAYGDWSVKVARSEVQSDLKNAAAAMENARNFGSGYPLSVPTTFKQSAGVTVTYKAGGTTSSYCLNGVSVKEPTVTYYLSSTGGNTSPVAGVCP